MLSSGGGFEQHKTFLHLIYSIIKKYFVFYKLIQLQILFFNIEMYSYCFYTVGFCTIFSKLIPNELMQFSLWSLKTLLYPNVQECVHTYLEMIYWRKAPTGCVRKQKLVLSHIIYMTYINNTTALAMLDGSPVNIWRR